MSDVTIVDYGVGNLFNLQRALDAVGAKSVISRNKDELLNAKRMILPGVGAFEAGMQHLEEYDLVQTVKSFVKSGKPLFGICLGMQLLMSESEENGTWKGLDLIPGRVIRFRPPLNGVSYKIPQIGWNAIHPPEQSAQWQGNVLSGVPVGSYVYFVHSYHVVPEEQSTCIGMTQYGRDNFCSVIRKNNISGCQFHPERSADPGLKILKNFTTQS